MGLEFVAKARAVVAKIREGGAAYRAAKAAAEEAARVAELTGDVAVKAHAERLAAKVELVLKANGCNQYGCPAGGAPEMKGGDGKANAASDKASRATDRATKVGGKANGALAATGAEVARGVNVPPGVHAQRAEQVVAAGNAHASAANAHAEAAKEQTRAGNPVAAATHAAAADSHAASARGFGYEKPTGAARAGAGGKPYVEHHTAEGTKVTTHGSKKEAVEAGTAIRRAGGSAFVHEVGDYNRLIKGPSAPAAPAVGQSHTVPKR
jgi:hypothetical protein